MKAQLKIVTYQLALIIIIASTAYGLNSALFGFKGVLYGGAVSVIASIVMACRINQAAGKVIQGKESGHSYIYLAAIERLLLVIVLFGLGFMWLKLHPLPLVIGLIAGQVGFILGGYKMKE